jgi:ribosomal-protein-alanine N-acetyltransferase
LSIQLHLIASPRLDLISMSPEFLQASIARDQAQSESILGVAIIPNWFEEQSFMQLRLDQIQRDPAYQPWSVRAIILRDQQIMIGYMGFHTQPDPTYLKDLAPGGVEFGYEIFTQFRRQGYASEASQALMHWAHDDQHIDRFVLSISPDNVPSLRIAERLGFTQIGSHIDEEDGLEHVFAFTYP